MTLFAEIIGYLAAITGISIMIPQVIKSIKTKKVDDIAWGMLFMYAINCVLWIIYGFLIAAWPLAITNAIVLVIIILQLFLKKTYSSR